MVKKLMIAFFGFLLVIVLILGLGMISGYNKLVDQNENINQKYAQIEVRLQERHDKISQLVDAVSGLQEHEQAIYDAIVAARQAYTSASTMDEYIAADAAEASALTRLIAVVEDNPSLIVSGAYQTLLDEISSMESALAVARRDYNLAIQEYNVSVRKFPRILYASLLGFEKDKPYWKMDDGANEVPDVVFE